MKKKIIYPLAIALTVTFAISSCETTIAQSKEGVRIERIDAKAFKAELAEAKDVLVLDVRTPDEFSAGHIDKAKNLNFFDKDFKSQLDKLDKKKPVFLYCQSGGRSGKALKIMSDMGFENVVEMQGGWGAWSRLK